MLDATVNRNVINFVELPLKVQELLIREYPELVKEVECLEFNFNWQTRNTIEALGLNPYRGWDEEYTVGDLLKELKVAIPNLENDIQAKKEYPDLLTYLKDIMEKAKTLPKNLKVEVSV